MRISEEWLRRFWQGSCDGAVYDCAELYPLHFDRRPRPWDSVVNYSLLLSGKATPPETGKIQTWKERIRFFLKDESSLIRIR